MLPPRLPQHVPRALAHRDLAVELPPELAGVRDPLGPHGVDLADVQVARRHVRERVVGDVDVRDGLQDVAGARAPQAEREQRTGPDGELDALAGTALREEPRAVVLAGAAARDDAEPVLVLPGHGEVAPDPPDGVSIEV